MACAVRAVLKLARRSQQVDVAVDEGGVLVAGTRENVDRVVAELSRVAGSAGRAASVTADGAMLATTVYGFVKTHAEYFRFSDAARKQLERHGPIPTGGGFFRSFVRDRGRFAGNLDWKPVDLSPEQALSMQTAAATLALRAAIKEVQEAVERVEDKLDNVAKLLRSDRLGDALGDRRTLTELMSGLRAEGSILAADWAAVATLGPQITRDIEGLRAHVRLLLQRESGGWTTRARADDVEDLLADSWLKETVALLVVCEDNLAMWHELRLAHIRATERDNLRRAVDDARSAIDRDRRDDQALVAAVEAAIAELVRARGIEGLAPLQSQKLRRGAEELASVNTWFADQRLLDAAPVEELQLPGVVDSLRHVARTAGGAVEDAVQAGRRLLRRGDDAADGETPPLPAPGESRNTELDRSEGGPAA